jgi:hypothetical protein
VMMVSLHGHPKVAELLQLYWLIQISSFCW